MQKNKRSLAKQFILSFSVVVLILCSMTALFGLKGFTESVEQQYFDMANLVADTVEEKISDVINNDELKHYGDVAVSGNIDECNQVSESDEYKTIKAELESLQKNLQLTDIYVIRYTSEELNAYKKGDTSWKPLIYIFDNYVKAEESFTVGDRSSMNPKNLKLFAEVVDQKVPQDDFIISFGEFGNNISALHPVLDKNGDIAAVIGVEVPMIRVKNATIRFLFRTMLLTMGILIIIIILFVIYLYRVVARPVDIMAKEVCRFGRENNRTEESIKTLGRIKTRNEIQTLSEYIDKMEKDMLEYVENIKSITAEKERIGAELNVATQIQADMLPCIFPAFPDRKEFDIFASMTPAKEVGGDFYDFFLLDDDHIALVMADVSGKGVPAALFMVISKTLIKDQAQMCRSPKTILEDVNNKLIESNAEGMFVTVWLGIMEISTGHIVAANAGHEYPAIRNSEGKFELIKDKHGMMVGAMQGISYKEYEMDLGKGECLFLYTDGVPEATNADNELFGTDRMIDALNIDPMADPDKLLPIVKKSVDEFVGSAPQFDDLTMLAIRRN